MGRFEEEWRKRFENFALDHEVDHLISGWSANGLRRRLHLFGELFEQGKIPVPARILDLGCGAGTYVRFLADLGHQVVGLDYSLPSLSRALAADPKKTGHYVEGEAYSLPFRDECFDFVVSIGVFQTLGNPKRALDEMVRVLRPNGLLVVELLNAFEVVALAKAVGGWLTSTPPDVRVYSPYGVDLWFSQCGLKITRRSGVYLPPRQLPWLGQIFDCKTIVQLLERIPGLSVAAAHAFLFVAEKAVI